MLQRGEPDSCERNGKRTEAKLKAFSVPSLHKDIHTASRVELPVQISKEGKMNKKNSSVWLPTCGKLIKEVVLRLESESVSMRGQPLVKALVWWTVPSWTILNFTLDLNHYETCGKLQNRNMYSSSAYDYPKKQKLHRLVHNLLIKYVYMWTTAESYSSVDCFVGTKDPWFALQSIQVPHKLPDRMTFTLTFTDMHA